jgi:hypothetical protein
LIGLETAKETKVVIPATRKGTKSGTLLREGLLRDTRSSSVKHVQSGRFKASGATCKPAECELENPARIPENQNGYDAQPAVSVARQVIDLVACY